MAQKVRHGDSSVLLPILAYYGTGRLWAKKREKRENAKVNLDSRFAGYADCLDSMSNEKLLYKWLEQMTYQELQEQKAVPELEAVKELLYLVLFIQETPNLKAAQHSVAIMSRCTRLNLSIKPATVNRKCIHSMK